MRHDDLAIAVGTRWGTGGERRTEYELSSRSVGPTKVLSPPAIPRRSRAERDQRVANERLSLPRVALAYAARCHVGQRQEGDGAPFIEHVSAVACLLRDAGCSDVVVAAGLLHRVTQYTDVGSDELTERFGAAVSGLVRAVSEDSVGRYSQRKAVLREQVREAGRDAALLFAAVEIAEVRALSDEVRRERPRRGVQPVAEEARRRRERYQRMRLESHDASLTMLRSLAPGHRLVRQLAIELDGCPISVHRPRRAGADMPATG